MDTTPDMVRAYINAVTDALTDAGHHPVGMDGRPPVSVWTQTDEGDYWIATICIPDPADDRTHRRSGYAVQWGLDDGWTVACWSFDGQTQLSMHTDLELGIVPDPEIIVQAIEAVLKDGGLTAGRVLPGTAELLARYAAD